MKILLIILSCSFISLGFSSHKNPKSDDFEFLYEDLSVSKPEEATDNSDCPQNTLGQASKTFEVNCKPSWRKEKYCRCVRAEAENNVFVKINLTNPQNVNDEIEKNQIKYTKRFVSAYSQMTIEADLQEQVLGLNLNPPGEQIANCPPKAFAENVKINSKEHFAKQKVLLEKMLADRTEALIECESVITKKIAKNKMDKLSDQNGKCSKLRDSIKTINLNLNPEGGEQIDQADQGCATSATRLTKIALRKRLDIALAHYSSPKYKNIAMIAQTKEMIQTIEENDKNLCFAPGFSPSEMATTFLTTFDVEYGAVGGMTNRDGQCDDLTERGTKELCLALENTNTVLADDLKNQYDFNPKKDCISFAEFKTFKGMPQPELLDAFSSLSRLFGGDLLETPANDNTELKKQRLNFLRSNPLIAKVAQNDESRKSLGGMLKKLSKSLDGKNEFERFNAYLAFMKDGKNGLKSLLINSKAEPTDMYICAQLTQNFTAIQVSNDLPQVEKDDSEDVFEGNLRKIKGCQFEERNEVSVTKLEETLQSSPIFSLAPDDVEADKKKVQAEFEKFKGKYCDDYQGKIAGYTGTPEERRQQFLAKGPFSGYKKSLDENGVPATANIDWDEARRSTSGSRQDKDRQRIWDTNVRPKMSKSSVMLKGEEDKFLEDKVMDRATASAADAPSPAKAPKIASGTNSSGSDTNTTATPATGTPNVAQFNQPDSGQQIPDYVQEPPVDLSKAATAKNIPEMIPDYENKSLVDKEQSLEDTKEYLSKKAPELLEKFPLDEEIKKLEKKIAQSEEDRQSTTENQTTTPLLNKILSKIGINPQEGTNSAGTGSTTDKAVVSKTAKGHGKKNDAIVSIHEEGLKDGETKGGRSPSNIGPVIVTSNTVIDFDAFKIQPSTIPEELKNMSTLEAETPDQYNKIYANFGDLKTFIAKKLEGKIIELQVIKIKDPLANPERFQLIAVSADSRGHLKVNRIDRVYTAKNLQNSF